MDADRVVAEFLVQPCSAATLRQRRWAMAAFTDFVRARGVTVSMSELSKHSLDFVTSPFLHGPPSPATVRARRGVLAAFFSYAKHSGRVPTLPAVPPVSLPPARVGRLAASHIMSRHAVSLTWARTAAQVALLTQVPLRSAQMCQLGVSDISGSTVHTAFGPVTMKAPVAALMRNWVNAREAVLTAVQGGKSSLWVTVAANHVQGAVTPPGVPLRPRGLQRAFAHAVTVIQEEDPPPEPFLYPNRWEWLRLCLHQQEPR